MPRLSFGEADVGTDRSRIVSLLTRLHDLGANELIALEVIWSPAIDADRMSTLELEQFYPELKRLDSSVPSGPIWCTHCNAEYAAELGKCPTCGSSR